MTEMDRRIFYSPDFESTNELPEDESAHCLRVLRYGIGDEIEVTDGRGHFYKARISSTIGKRCHADVAECIGWVKPWTNHIHIAVAPTKNMERIEWMVEKMTEIGFDELTFINCRYSERRVVKFDRVERIVVSAMKQSHKAVKPTVNEMTDYEDFIARSLPGRRMIAHCHDGHKEFLTATLRHGEDVVLLIGPEGDFSEDEVSHAIAAGYEPVSLGNSRLRTETAAMVGCVAINLCNQM